MRGRSFGNHEDDDIHIRRTSCRLASDIAEARCDLMSISHRHRCLFFHVPKTAGCAIAGLGFLDEYVGHVPATAIRGAVSPAVWDACYKFAFVRNPWDRFLSTYAYFRGMGPGHRWYTHENVEIARQVQAWGDFDAFCRKFPTTALPGNRHFLPQLYWISDRHGRILMDYVGRYETLRRDWDQICTEIALPAVPLPLTNASVHLPYAQYYNDERRDYVREIYSQDVEALGYTFDGSVLDGPLSSELRKASE